MDYLSLLVLFLGFSGYLCDGGNNPIINGENITEFPVTEVNSADPPTTSKTTISPITHETTTTTTTAKPVTTSTTSSTTTAPKTKSTTVEPSTTSTNAPLSTTTVPHHARTFDGPSFVGGIILALGLVAIGFVAFKFYKARTEMNYHTL